MRDGWYCGEFPYNLEGRMVYIAFFEHDDDDGTI